MFAARRKRKIAQSRLCLATKLGIDLMERPKNEEQQLKGKAIWDGLDYLEDAMGRYGTAHSEVQHQFRQMAQKGKDSEDNEAALMQEAMSTTQKLYILLEEAKAAAVKQEAESDGMQRAAVAEVKVKP